MRSPNLTNAPSTRCYYAPAAMKTKNSSFLIALLLLPTVVSAQLLSYESFTGIPVASGLSGSGADATGWTDSGWSGGSDARFQVVDPAPDLTLQISGGALVNGSNRAVQLSTSPEPVPGTGLVASRSIPPQNTTLYVSFLVRPMTIGTGSDSIDVRFNSGTTLLARIAFQPEQNQQYLQASLPFDGGTGGGNGNYSFPPLYAPQTYFVVVRLSRPIATQIKVEASINPPAAYTGNFTHYITKNLSGSPLLNSIGPGIASTDTGGPTTTAIIDELRVGYTWADVVPPGPPAALVPDVTIGSAVKLRWQSQTGKTYQPQYSYDLSSWFNLGLALSGNGQVKEVFDSTDSDAKKFYRVQIQ